jgi:hypothetical protein
MKKTPISSALARFFARLPLSAVASILIMAFPFALGGPAWSATTVLDFDSPAFTSGQTITSTGGVTFTGSLVVFGPTVVSTYTPTNAARSTLQCTDTACSSGANSLGMQFADGVSAVSLRAGSDESTVQFCFPEQDCQFVARLIGYDINGVPIAASTDTIVAAWSRNPAGYGPITTELSITDSAARIRSATLTIGTNLLSGSNIGGRVQIDHLSFTVPDTPLPEPNPPQKPTIQITSPLPDQCFDSGPAVGGLSGSVTMNGLLELCTFVNGSSIVCGQGVHVQPDGKFSAHLDLSRLKPGFNTLQATVYDLAGQSATAEVRIQLPEENDLRITSMEVTQGIQHEQLPLNTGQPILYSGVKLIKGGKTIVRVFANRTGGQCGPEPLMSVLLTGLAPHPSLGQEILGSMLPDNGTRNLSRGKLEVMFAEERSNPDGAFVFTLPPSWSARDVITLRATVSQYYRYPPLEECANCTDNNTMVLDGVRFEPRSTITISPVEVIWTDSTGTVVRPSAPSSVFARAAAISPLPEGGLIVRPYAGQIDVTDIIQNDKCDDSCRDEIFNRVAAFEIRDLPGYTIGVSRKLHIGLERPVVYVRPPFGLAGEPIAIVDDGPRPLTIVTHEFYHQLAFYHAGLSCPPGFPTISWPPDDRGLIHGIGLDRRPGIGPKPGTYRIIAPGASGQPPEYFDLMSYCANGDSNAWISVRNWNASGSTFPNGVIPDDTLPDGQIGEISSAPAAPAPTDQQTLRVVATTDGFGKVRILSIQSGTGGFTTNYVKESPYKLIVLDNAGQEIATSFLAPLVGPVHGGGHGREVTLSAEVVAPDATAIRITYKGETKVEQVRSPNSPQLTILSPRAGDHLSGTDNIAIRWEVTDADGDRPKVRVEYSTDDGSTYKVLSSGVTKSEVVLPARLFSRSDRARIRLVANDGFNDGVTVSERFIAEGSVPQVRITDPPSDTSIIQGAELHLVGEAYDDYGISIKESLEWYDNDKLLGLGEKLNVANLSPGIHLVQFRTRDTVGRTSSASIRVTVLPQRPPSRFSSEEADDLLTQISSFNWAEAPRDDVVGKLKALRDDAVRGDPIVTCARLSDLLNAIKSQEGNKRIMPEEARSVIEVSTRIRTVIGCS